MTSLLIFITASELVFIYSVYLGIAKHLGIGAIVVGLLFPPFLWYKTSCFILLKYHSISFFSRVFLSVVFVLVCFSLLSGLSGLAIKDERAFIFGLAYVWSCPLMVCFDRIFFSGQKRQP